MKSTKMFRMVYCNITFKNFLKFFSYTKPIAENYFYNQDHDMYKYYIAFGDFKEVYCAYTDCNEVNPINDASLTDEIRFPVKILNKKTKL